MATTLILGGRRAGKSQYAQHCAAAAAAVCVIVTAEVHDAEMAARVAQHQADRPAHWQTVEAPFELTEALWAHAQVGRTVVVDCLTLWLTNHLLNKPHQLAQTIDALLACVASLPGDILLVSNEVGWSVVPDNALARQFADEVGRLHQRLAACCDQVVLVVAGLPLQIKGGA